MFTIQQAISLLILGLVWGAVAGYAACLILVADPLRRQRDLLRDRNTSLLLQMFTRRTDATANRHAWSRKAPPLRRVQ